MRVHLFDRFAPLGIGIMLALLVIMGAHHLIADMFGALTLPTPTPDQIGR